MHISVIVPVYNEATNIKNNLAYFKRLSRNAELIFVDGKSTDGTDTLLKEYGFSVVTTTQTSRGAQLSLGVKKSHANILLFHHFDTVLPTHAISLITEALKTHHWGRFDIKIDDEAKVFRVIEVMMNLRSRWTNIMTGDQAMFFKREAYTQYVVTLDNMPLMEDIYLSKRLKKSGPATFINDQAKVSSRYWRKHGIVQSIIKMWVFRFLYFIGVSPQRLYKLYYS